MGMGAYLAGWAVYLTAGVVCYLMFHRFTATIPFKPLANGLRGIMLALMFTPWYVAPDMNLMAPAVLVILLDMITQGGTTFVRALVPLVMAIVLALILAIAGGAIRRVFSKRIPNAHETP